MADDGLAKDQSIAGQCNEESTGRSERLNETCFCITLDRSTLRNALDAEVGSKGFASDLERSHPSLFSNVPVFVSHETMAVMVRVVEAVETAIKLPAYRDAVLAWSVPVAAVDFGPVGALMGYDFHIGAGTPRLIEVNTNAGGAFLNSALAAAQRSCCNDTPGISLSRPSGFGAAIGQMMIDEWRRQRGTGTPLTIAIVDDAPTDQYLLPEFRLAKSILEQQGFIVTITDPMALISVGSGLEIGGRSIDLVYNRLVDFGLDEPRHAQLRHAYELGGVVVTPNPHVHAMIADKRNLSLLSDVARLERWGLAGIYGDTLRQAIPLTEIVVPSNADRLWDDRRNLFFKPTRGHGSKGAYRGDKLTRRVWGEILSGTYVAQRYAASSERIVSLDGAVTALKVDIRLYTYNGQVLLAAARLYQGQTTNMRTPGGGFAPVLELMPSPIK